MPRWCKHCASPLRPMDGYQRTLYECQTCDRLWEEHETSTEELPYQERVELQTAMGLGVPRWKLRALRALAFLFWYSTRLLGLTPAMVAGTQMGAIVGAMYAVGICKADAMSILVTMMENSWRGLYQLEQERRKEGK